MRHICVPGDVLNADVLVPAPHRWVLDMFDVGFGSEFALKVHSKGLLDTAVIFCSVVSVLPMEDNNKVEVVLEALAPFQWALIHFVAINGQHSAKAARKVMEWAAKDEKLAR